MEVRIQAKVADAERVAAKIKAQLERQGKTVIIRMVRKGSNG